MDDSAFVKDLLAIDPDGGVHAYAVRVRQRCDPLGLEHRALIPEAPFSASPDPFIFSA